ncbi:MAG: hypothetical protein ACTHOJ_16220 [Sphingomonas oligoaromativorans]
MPRIAAVPLAAGLSSRVGWVDKLLVPLNGLVLGQLAARPLAGLSLHTGFVLSGDARVEWPCLDIVVNDRAEAGL